MRISEHARCAGIKIYCVDRFRIARAEKTLEPPGYNIYDRKGKFIEWRCGPLSQARTDVRRLLEKGRITVQDFETENN